MTCIIHFFPSYRTSTQHDDYAYTKSVTKISVKSYFANFHKGFSDYFFYYFLHIIDFQNNKNTLKNIRNQKLF
ncbi:hypothetical protein TFKS16_0824 [Tannerella forsythia KS16]|uniref:Uncharacterized protein n=2 Tax=Tannerella forsythia TaxID=28112 RepID=G8UKM6_TANFA|nr:hypothetical protein BFO_1416 [Tannerella forsythia 92A2]KKY60955.1 hypothetical protein Tanf_09925 [Tannerella forsythia]PDP44084.1 hypothetical protein CLI86_05280 [Tannerella forsythia]PDP71749.1 hypothetical protein CLI85_02555 [Tannerella forsythia]BAR51116.1 hypothetical protein TFKS16_0824 [Tannerella forsythia KS16]